MRVGLIGAGLLGSAIAERLIKSGFTVDGFDTDPDRMTALSAIGARPAASAREAACAEFVLLSLPDSSVSTAVVEDIAGQLGASTILVDTTTGEPAEMERISRRVPRFLDATVAGSSEQVRSREALVMAGGDLADFEACSELLATFASRVLHAGPCGAGARMKLVVNLVLGLNRAALAEGLAFAEAAGVDLSLALEALRSSPAYSTAMDRKGAKMINRDWTPEARLRQHYKDVRLILAEARRHGIALPLSNTHEKLLAAAKEAGFSEADNSAILEAFLRR